MGVLGRAGDDEERPAVRAGLGPDRAAGAGPVLDPVLDAPQRKAAAGLPAPRPAGAPGAPRSSRRGGRRNRARCAGRAGRQAEDHAAGGGADPQREAARGRNAAHRDPEDVVVVPHLDMGRIRRAGRGPRDLQAENHGPSVSNGVDFVTSADRAPSPLPCGEGGARKPCMVQAHRQMRSPCAGREYSAGAPALRLNGTTAGLCRVLFDLR